MYGYKTPFLKVSCLVLGDSTSRRLPLYEPNLRSQRCHLVYLETLRNDDHNLMLKLNPPVPLNSKKSIT